MTITSFEFLGFVLVTLIAFRLFPVKKQWWVLLAASVVFYLSFSIAGIFVMIGTALLTYFAALWVQKYKDSLSEWMKENKKTADKETRKTVKASYQKKQKLIVAGTVVITIGILFMCKYYKVLAIDFNNLFHSAYDDGRNFDTKSTHDFEYAIGVYSLFRGWDGWDDGSMVWADIREYARGENLENDYENVVFVCGHTQLENEPIIREWVMDLDCRKPFVLDTQTGNIKEYK